VLIFIELISYNLINKKHPELKDAKVVQNNFEKENLLSTIGILGTHPNPSLTKRRVYKIFCLHINILSEHYHLTFYYQ